MNTGRHINRLAAARRHRQTWYERYLDLLMQGKVTPAQVTERWNKLQQVKP